MNNTITQTPAEGGENMRNITRFTYEWQAFQGWRVSITRGGVNITRYFSDKEYGTEQDAKAAAIAFRNSLLEDIGQAKRKKARNAIAPENVTSPARKRYKKGVDRIEQDAKDYLRIVFFQSINKQLEETEKAIRHARKMRATAHLLNSLYEYEISLNKSIPDKETIKATANTIAGAHGFTLESWDWQAELQEALRASPYFDEVKKHFLP